MIWTTLRHVVLGLLLLGTAVAGEPWSSPNGIAYSPDGAVFAVADTGRGEVVALTTATGAVLWRRTTGGSPTGIAWSTDGSRVWAGDATGDTIWSLDGATGTMQTSIRSHPLPRALACRGQELAIASAGPGHAAIRDQATGGERWAVEAGYQTEAIQWTPDGRTLVTVPLVPQGTSSPDMAIAVRLLDGTTGTLQASLPLPPGSTAGRGCAITPDGRWALVTHVIGKADMPNTHVDRGWVNTNALTVIDIPGRNVVASLLLDRLDHGSADPWGVAISPDGQHAWVALSGAAVVAHIDLAHLIALLSGRDGQAATLAEPWPTIAKNLRRRGDLAYELGALDAAHLIRRIPMPGHGPRQLAVSPDGRTVAVGLHWDGSVAIIDTTSMAVRTSWRWSTANPPDAARRGAILFHDATNSYQGWVSCATCHPGVRADGLNWDLLNDGVGNPKNTRSLLFADRRAPVMSLGVRKDGPTAVRAGFRFIAFHEPQQQQVDDLLTFLRQLPAETSPYSLRGRSPAAERGAVVFAERGACISCHSGPYRSDQKLHDVGTILNPRDTGRAIVTPMLVELWRTAPYLHDGSAATLLDVLTTRNPAGDHSAAADLTPAEREDLIAFLLSL